MTANVELDRLKITFFLLFIITASAGDENSSDLDLSDLESIDGEENESQNLTTPGSLPEIEFEEENPFELREGHHFDAIIYVRKMVKYFRKSPKKMSELQSLISRKEGKTLTLFLDMKIRWVSLLPMIKRYLRVKEYIQAILEEYDQSGRYSSSYDDVLLDIVNTLEPLQEAIIALSQCDTNIMIAEGAISFVLDHLNSRNTCLSRKMFDALLQRYSQRRLKDLVSLLLTLQTKAYPVKAKVLDYSSPAVIKKTAQDLICRLFQDTEIEEQNDDTDDEVPVDMKSVIAKLISTRPAAKEGKLDKDFKLLESRGELSSRLSNLHTALLSIRPTSTTCEQAFSVAGIFKTKLRNRLSRKSLNALLILKYHFCKK